MDPDDKPAASPMIRARSASTTASKTQRKTFLRIPRYFLCGGSILSSLDDSAAPLEPRGVAFCLPATSRPATSCSHSGSWGCCFSGGCDRGAELDISSCWILPSGTICIVQYVQTQEDTRWNPMLLAEYAPISRHEVRDNPAEPTKDPARKHKWRG